MLLEICNVVRVDTSISIHTVTHICNCKPYPSPLRPYVMQCWCSYSWYDVFMGRQCLPPVQDHTRCHALGLLTWSWRHLITSHPMLSLHTRGLIKKRVSEYTPPRLTSTHPEQNHTVSQIPKSTQIQLGFKNLGLQVLNCKCPMLITPNMNRTFHALDLQHLPLNSKAQLPKLELNRKSRPLRPQGLNCPVM